MVSPSEPQVPTHQVRKAREIATSSDFCDCHISEKGRRGEPGRMQRVGEREGGRKRERKRRGRKQTGPRSKVKGAK